MSSSQRTIGGSVHVVVLRVAAKPAMGLVKRRVTQTILPRDLAELPIRMRGHAFRAVQMNGFAGTSHCSKAEPA